ncbi:MAG: T9SS type A sorting domain-containing protein, partial [Prevotella sp.]|nr:T9SS type A sorting domain-containing protein [Prevotella sp.]
SGMASVSLPLENLQHMHYEKATDEATAIGDIKVFDEKGGSERIDFSNLPADASVSIYTLDGKQLYSVRPGQGKNLSLPLGSLQSGIYLVKVNDVTYKIQKP